MNNEQIRISQLESAALFRISKLHGESDKFYLGKKLCKECLVLHPCRTFEIITDLEKESTE